MDWSKTVHDIVAELQSSAVDDFEQGYWLDVNEAVPPGLKISSVDDLRETLAEDVRSGLNWSGEKQFFFLLTVFSQPAPPGEAQYDDEVEIKTSANDGDDEIALSEPSQFELLEPKLADKEVAVIIRARNSAVATWLWRNYAAATPLAVNTVRIDPLCIILLPEDIDSGKD